jgi:hypothetical protein
MFLAQSTLVAVQEVDQRISFAIGGLALAILLGMLAALIVFGGGREHS